MLIRVCGAVLVRFALCVSVAAAAALTTLDRAPAQGGLPKITISGALDPDSIELYADKLDAYARLLAGTARTATNSIRYLKNFDPKIGPKGTETSTYDLLGLNETLYSNLARAAREAAAEKPAIPELDKAALAYADAISTNAAVFNEAAEYYSSAREYEVDKYERGKTLHPKIMREIDRYFATLPPFMGFLHQVRAQVDPQEIALVENGGRAPARVLARKLTTVGRQASLFVPLGPRENINTAAFDAAIKTYLDQANAYKRYRGSEAGQRDESLTAFSDGAVEKLFRELRDIRSAYDKRGPIPLQYELLILPFYEDYSRFWSEMLDIVARNPWDRSRPLDPAATARVTPPAPPIAMPDLDMKALAQWSAKVHSAQQVLIETSAPLTAWNRYAAWVDQRRGPTGKESGAGSFYPIDRAKITAAIVAARAQAGHRPPIYALDELLKRYADAMQTMLPVAGEASAYYERRDYLSDDMAGGKALHPRLMADYKPFLETRADLSRAVGEFRGLIDGREVALVEAEEGKSRRWARLNILHLARSAERAVPRSPEPSADELKAMDVAVAELARAVKALEAQNDSRLSGLVDEANSYIGRLRSLRQDYGHPLAKRTIDTSIMMLGISISGMSQAASAR